MNQTTQHSGHGGLSLWASGMLPSAHLLDGTWWFSCDTINFFRSRIDRLAFDERVVFLGTPSLFLDTLLRTPTRPALLFDRDAAIRDCLPRNLEPYLVTFDLSASLPKRLGADLVIGDPPWYMEELESFLAAAQAIARVGAEVQICIPPIGTRPGIESEREELISWAARDGLRLLQIVEGQVGYDTPPFERNVFRSTGEQVQANWRKGDLAIFVVDQLSGLKPRGSASVARWADVRLLRTRWRVAETAENGEDPALVSMGFAQDIFPSCSRRHSDRGRPVVWTSGNRTFLSSNPQGFLRILQSLRGDTVSEIASHARELYPDLESSQARAAAQIVALLDTEEQEVEALQRCLNGKEL
jgi:hypothetical protein